MASGGKFENSESELSEDAKKFLNAQARGEIRVCTRMSEIYPKNYYSWTHRAWVLDHVTNDIVRNRGGEENEKNRDCGFIIFRFWKNWRQ